MDPVLEVVMRGCADCTLETADIGRMVRAYGSTNFAIRCKGECSSYRFERCNKADVGATDVGQGTVFMSLFSQDVRFAEKGDGDDSSARSKESDEDYIFEDGDQCEVIIWDKGRRKQIIDSISQ